MNVRDGRRLRGEGEQLGREDDGETLEESIAALAREGLIYDTGRKQRTDGLGRSPPAEREPASTRDLTQA
jgi:hypothetical protein